MSHQFRRTVHYLPCCRLSTLLEQQLCRLPIPFWLPPNLVYSEIPEKFYLFTNISRKTLVEIVDDGRSQRRLFREQTELCLYPFIHPTIHPYIHLINQLTRTTPLPAPQSVFFFTPFPRPLPCLQIKISIILKNFEIV